MPPRLKRLDRVYQHSPIYFITTCTINRRPLLANEKIDQAFRVFIRSGPTYGAWTGRYVIMPDHFHLFVVVDDQLITLSAWMKALKGTLSSTLRALGNEPPYWQKGFFDRILRTGESYSEKWNYVRENPVRAGLAMTWKDWPYAGEAFDLEFNEARF